MPLAEENINCNETLRERSLMSGQEMKDRRGKCIFLRESPAGNGRVNTYYSENEAFGITI